MTTETYKLWIDYNYGIKKELTEEEKKEIFACEFAMHLLVPTKDISNHIKQMGGIEAIKSDSDKLNILANFYDVPREVILFKLNYMATYMATLKTEKGLIKKLLHIHKRNYN